MLNVLITGANKGIGFEMARQLALLGHNVILTARDPQKGKNAVNQLQSENLKATFVQLDITDDKSIEVAFENVKSKFGRLDVLMNNAAILLKQDHSLLNDEWSVIEKTIRADALSQLIVCRKFVPLISNGGKIIFTSSEGGSMTDSVGGWAPSYCISKSMLNAITRHLAHELQPKRITVNAFCPGWVRTDMGGKSAPRNVEQGAETGVWLAVTTSSYNGKFFRDKKIIPW
jgi:NAD(P)-dependent dehydrogenase (short-subunit alcohol dehydrogenase family)